MASFCLCILNCLFAIFITADGIRNIPISENIAIFRQFTKPRIYPNTSHIHVFIQDDGYIEQWLADSNYNIDNAVKKFIDNLAWRQAQKVDTIHLENWDYFQTEYPQFVNWSNDTCNVVGEVWTAMWNMRRAAFSGQSKMLTRWSVYLQEMTQRRLSENRLNPKFKNVSSVCRGIEIVDLGGFNSREHACVPCVGTIASFGLNAEEHYPNLWSSVYLINVGQVFRQVLATIGKGFKTLSNGVMKLYTVREEWMPVLDKEINKNQRSQRFGGSLNRNFR